MRDKKKTMKMSVLIWFGWVFSFFFHGAMILFSDKSIMKSFHIRNVTSVGLGNFNDKQRQSVDFGGNIAGRYGIKRGGETG